MLATLAGFALRLVLLHAYPLREDEAIYSMWARAAWHDPWYLHAWPDKPPLFLWLQAAALRLWGASDAGARLLSIFASTATIPLMAAAARRVWPAAAARAAGAAGAAGAAEAAVATAWLLALNPFAISFAPTAYTDPLLVLWGMLALALGLRGRWLGAGAALGAAIMTKQQGLLYLPLIVALPLACAVAGTRLRAWAQLTLGAALILLPLLAWDAMRWATAPSPWDLGVRNYGVLRLAPPDSWLERARGWGDLLRYMGGNWAGWLALAALALGGARAALRRTAPHPGTQSASQPVNQSTSQPINQSTGVPWLLGAWALGFLLLHTLTTVQVWDRYLLPLAPLFALWVGGLAATGSKAWGAESGERGAGDHRPDGARLIAGLGALLVLALLGWPAVTAARGGYPIGADHGAYSGLNEALAWVAAQGPQKQLLYHNALGWNAQYTLYDAIQAGDVELRWFASSTALADNAAKSAWLARTLVVPDWAPVHYLADALAQRGLRLVKQVRAGQMTIYSIVEGTHAQEMCAWCVSRVAAPAPWPLAYPFDPTIAAPAQ